MFDRLPRPPVYDSKESSGMIAWFQHLYRRFIQLPTGKIISGLTYSVGTDATNDVDIAVGMAMDANDDYLMRLPEARGKRSDAVWEFGGTATAPLGALDTGTVGNSDYYIWLIAKPSVNDGAVDVLFSLSSTAPTMPTLYIYKRLIGWFKRTAGTIVAFKTYETEGGGIEMTWLLPTLDVVSSGGLTTSRRTDVVKVPTTFSVIAHLNATVYDASAIFCARVCCPDETDAAPSRTGGSLANISTDSTAADVAAQLFVRTNVSGLIAARADFAAVDSYRVSTIGFRWERRN